MTRAKKAQATKKAAGVKQAAVIANAERPLDVGEEPEQIDLIADLGLPIEKKLIDHREKHGRGRPLGSRNKRTVEMANYLLNRYRSPLETLAQIQSSGIAELAIALGCTKVEALQEIRLAAIALKDHLHSKMPVALDVTSRKVIHLTITEEGGGAPELGQPAGGVGLVGEIIDLTAQETGDPKA